MKELRIGKLRLICGDCMEVMQHTESFAYDLAVVDPDYGLKRKLRGGSWAQKWGTDGMTLGGVPDKAYFDELRRVSRNQIVWGGNYFINFLVPSRCFLIWDKIEKTHTMADCEMAWTSFDRNAKVFTSARNPGGITGKKRIHVCQKPVQLYMWIIDNYTSEGERVIDTHLGSASSAIAVYEVNKKLRSEGKNELEFTGIEINAEYFDKAVERVMRHIEAHPCFETHPYCDCGKDIVV